MPAPQPNLPAVLGHIDLEARLRLIEFLGQVGACNLRATCKLARDRVDDLMARAWVDVKPPPMSPAANSGSAGDAARSWWQEQWPLRASWLLRALRRWPRCSTLVLRAEPGGCADLLRPFADTAAAAAAAVASAAGGADGAAAGPGDACGSCAVAEPADCCPYPQVTTLELYSAPPPPPASIGAAAAASAAAGPAATPPRAAAAALTPAFMAALVRLFPNLETLVLRGKWVLLPDGDTGTAGGGSGDDDVERLLSPLARSEPSAQHTARGANTATGQTPAGGGGGGITCAGLRRLELPAGLFPGAHIRSLTQLQHLRLAVPALEAEAATAAQQTRRYPYGDLLAGLPALSRLQSLVLSGGPEVPSRELLAALPGSLELMRLEALAPPVPPPVALAAPSTTHSTAADDDEDDGGDDEDMEVDYIDGDGGSDGGDDSAAAAAGDERRTTWQYDYRTGQLRMAPSSVDWAPLVDGWKPLAEHLALSPTAAAATAQRPGSIREVFVNSTMMLVGGGWWVLPPVPQDIVGSRETARITCAAASPPELAARPPPVPGRANRRSLEPFLPELLSLLQPPSPSPPLLSAAAGGAAAAAERPAARDGAFASSPPPPPPAAPQPPTRLRLRHVDLIGFGQDAVLLRLLSGGGRGGVSVSIDSLEVFADGYAAAAGGGFPGGGGGAAAATPRHLHVRDLPALLRGMALAVPEPACLPRNLMITVSGGLVCGGSEDAEAGSTSTTAISGGGGGGGGGGGRPKWRFAAELAEALALWPPLRVLEVFQNPREGGQLASAGLGFEPGSGSDSSAARSSQQPFSAGSAGGGGAGEEDPFSRAFGTPSQVGELVRVLFGALAEDDGDAGAGGCGTSESPTSTCRLQLGPARPARLEAIALELVAKLPPDVCLQVMGADGQAMPFAGLGDGAAGAPGGSVTRGSPGDGSGGGGGFGGDGGGAEDEREALRGMARAAAGWHWFCVGRRGVGDGWLLLHCEPVG
ncbi:hypothetical protein PLESTM_000253300 [Pleodorina starrii]|nr:hypothetical protein PLESTM_000253300 [Pleodorina starrii]